MNPSLTDQDHPLGRLPSVDPRDRAYPMAAAGLPARRPRVQRRHWTTGPVPNQSDAAHRAAAARNSCVGQTCAGWLQATPVPTFDGPSAIVIYKAALLRDEWAWNDNQDRGTSIRAALAYLHELGRLGSYVWAQNADDVVNWVLRRGPVMCGTYWLEAMNEPDGDGRVHPRGAVRGGHAYLCYGVDLRTSPIRLKFQNSWGVDWSVGGRFWLSLEDFATLLDMDGEAVVGTERRIAPGSGL